MTKRGVIRKNTDAVRSVEQKLSAVLHSQIAEMALIAKKDISPAEATELFSECFDKPCLSAEMLLFSAEICRSVPTAKETRDTCAVACMKNPLTLRALTQLTQSIPTVHLREQSDFRASCEAVQSDTADYCILPVCSSHDGYYPTFSKLLRSYELKICRQTRVSKGDSDEEIQFALLAKKTEPSPEKKTVMFSFAEEDRSTLPCLLGAMHLCNMEIIGVNSSPLEYNMDRLYHIIEVNAADISTDALFFFLEAALPSHTVLGIY